MTVNCKLKGLAGAVKVILFIELYKINIFNEIKATLNMGRIVGKEPFLDTFVCFSPLYNIFITLTSY